MGNEIKWVNSEIKPYPLNDDHNPSTICPKKNYVRKNIRPIFLTLIPRIRIQIKALAISINMKRSQLLSQSISNWRTPRPYRPASLIKNTITPQSEYLHGRVKQSYGQYQLANLAWPTTIIKLKFLSDPKSPIFSQDQESNKTVMKNPVFPQQHQG